MKQLIGLLILLLGISISLYLIIDPSKSPISSSAEETKKNPPTEPGNVPDQMKLKGKIDQYRIQNDLRPLIEDSRLCEYAIERLDEMGYQISHDGFSKTSQSLKNKTGYSIVGENLNSGYRSSTQALEGWKGSPPHNAAMLNPVYTHTCVRCDGSYCVQLFGAK